MFNQDLFLDMFIALFALLNPLFAIPVFLGLTAHNTSRERLRTAGVSAVTALIALIVAAAIGDHILLLIGVHVPSFQIAGGLIVLTIALGMLKGEHEEDKDAEEALHRRKVHEGKNIAVYPLTIPLLTGPGVFVTTIVFSSRAQSLGDFVTLVGAIAAIVAILWLSMVFAGTASRYLNHTAIDVGTKILGILLAAVSVEMIIAGIDAHFIPLFASG